MKKSEKYNETSFSSVFSENIFNFLNEDQKNIMLSYSEKRIYSKYSALYEEGAKPSGVFLIKSGIVKIFKTNNHTGKEHIIRFAKSGDIIGFRSVISNETFCTSAKAIEETVVFFIPSSIFYDFIKENHNFSMQLITLSCKELGESNKFITDLALKSLRERIAEILILFYNTFGLDENNFIRITLNREDIANVVGTATESLIRQLSDLKKEGIIDLKGKKIKILDLKKLQKISSI